MTEPTRWLDDPRTDSSLREVLGAGSDVPPMPAEAHAQMTVFAAGLAAKGAATQTALGSSALKSLGSFLGIHGTGKAIVVASMMSVLGVGSYWGVKQYVAHKSAVAQAGSSRPADARTPGVQPPAVLPAVAELPAAVEAPAASEPSTAQVSPVRAAEAHGSSEPAVRSNSAQSGAGAFEELSIADEARLLERARAALATDPNRALEIANAHQQLYPTGQMSAERELIAVDALLRLGRRAEAEQRAAPRLRQFPNSLYARRLRQLLH